MVEGDSMILSPVNQELERGNVIVKPAHLEYPFIAENEYTCMELARRAGLPTPRVFLFQQPNLPLPRQHLVVERFDLCVVEGLEHRLNITEFAPLMGLVSAQKYEPSTEELFAFAEQILTDEDMKMFAKSYLLGAIVRNGDMHAKNFSIAIDNNIPRLTPVYDMVNTEVYGISGVLALKLAGDHSPKMIDIAKHLLKYLTLNSRVKFPLHN
jgi:serine/threonine-protein kinase HipA